MADVFQTFRFVVKFRTKQKLVSLSLPNDVVSVATLVGSLRIIKIQLTRNQGSFPRSWIIHILSLKTNQIHRSNCYREDQSSDPYSITEIELIGHYWSGMEKQT